MRPSNAFWLLAGSSLSAAAPIVLFKTQGSPTQITMSAKFGLEEAGSHISPKVSNTQNIPPLDLPEARPDNRPYMPSEDVTPSEALTSPQPLTTTYLLSLKPDSDQKETSQPSANLDLPSNSIALEETGAADVPITLSIVQLETQGNEPVYYKVPCTMHIGAGHFHVVRVYADSSVVGLACVFLALVALVELWGPVSRLLSRLWNGGEYNIILGEDKDDEKAEIQVHTPVSHSQLAQMPTSTKPSQGEQV